MRWQNRNLSAAQQYLALRSNPVCGGGQGALGRGQLAWTWQAAPSPLGRIYTLRVEFKEGGIPNVFVDQPNLAALAEGRKLPHVYSESPTRLCLYLPSSGEWHGGSLIAKTLIPWAVVWLYFFEEWLVSDDWKGGGVHPTNDDPDDRENCPGITMDGSRGRRGRKVA
jgi:hypothetical protein